MLAVVWILPSVIDDTNFGSWAACIQKWIYSYFYKHKSLWNKPFWYICELSNTTKTNTKQLTHTPPCTSEFIWLYSIATCFSSWSHHQAIHKQVIHYWIVLSMWIHIFCFLSCVTNEVIIQHASLTLTIHHYMHKWSGSVLKLNLSKIYKTSI
jgi:hypothetical protein